MKEQGQFIQSDYFNNVGGQNTADSPMSVKDTQATGGANYSLTKTGAISKRRGHQKVNTSADTQLNTLGLGTRITGTGTKTTIRAAGTKLQAVNLDTPSFTNLSEDTTAAATDVLTSGSTQQVVMNEFNTSTNDILWCTGGGAGLPVGVYSTTKFTDNGVAVPTGSISTSVGGSGGTFVATGTYFYGVAFRKRSTQAISNVVLDKSAVVTATTQKVTITLSTISNNDTAGSSSKYDRVYIYRSAVGGVTSFTTGDLIAQVDASIALTTYVDDGTSISSSQNVPRSGSAILDNSVLDDGTYNVMTVWKRRLVTARNSTLFISDLNKPESWPTTNVLNIPSGGPITALAIISFSTAFSNDELLVIFKERETWIFTGTDIDDWALKFIDNVGCIAQNLVVYGNGFISWVSYRGVHLWDGSDKPVYISRLIENIFAVDGDLDKPKLNLGVGQFYQKTNEIIWFLSSKIQGEQKFALKLDLRLSLPQLETTLAGRIMEGVFAADASTIPVYAATSFIPQTSVEEYLLLGDASGFVYQAYNAYNDASGGISFTYFTPFLSMGDPNRSKRYHKAIVWVEEVGNWNLTLDYWTGYRAALDDKTSQAEIISSVEQSATALWDVGFWDLSNWDDFTPKLKPLVFNLNPGTTNSNEGDCLRLRFRQEGTNEPVTIIGYSVIYSEKGLAK